MQKKKKAKLNIKRLSIVFIIAIALIGAIGGGIYYMTIQTNQAQLANEKLIAEYTEKYNSLKPRINNPAFTDTEAQQIKDLDAAFQKALTTNPENIVSTFDALDAKIIEAETRVTNENAQAAISDYQLVFNMLKAHDTSNFSASEIATIDDNISKMQTAIDEKQVDQLEPAINNLAASIDSHYISSNDVEMTYRKGLLIANKDNCLPSTYAPDESEQGRAAFEAMAAAAATDGVSLNAFSTYRSYSGQEGLYNRYVAADGQEAADRYSARPGCSEHQTGLAFDIGGSDSSRWAETTFDGTTEAEWLASHSQEYGFILRYPPGKEDITGYMYESWHYRYVGEIAIPIYQSGKTLEEYLGLE